MLGSQIPGKFSNNNPRNEKTIPGLESYVLKTWVYWPSITYTTHWQLSGYLRIHITPCFLLIYGYHVM